jgi:phenol hydroxylase P2 protein
VNAALRPVSIDLQESEENRALIEAIEADNPEVTTRHLPGLIKLQAPGQIVINR